MQKLEELAEDNIQFQRCINRICESSVEMYLKGYPIAVIVDRLYAPYHRAHKAFTKTAIRDYVWKSIYDFIIKEKQQVGI